jgi:hypothetical protein
MIGSSGQNTGLRFTHGSIGNQHDNLSSGFRTLFKRSRRVENGAVHRPARLCRLRRSSGCCRGRSAGTEVEKAGERAKECRSLFLDLGIQRRLLGFFRSRIRDVLELAEALLDLFCVARELGEPPDYMIVSVGDHLIAWFERGRNRRQHGDHVSQRVSADPVIQNNGGRERLLIR